MIIIKKYIKNYLIFIKKKKKKNKKNGNKKNVNNNANKFNK